MCAKNDNFVVFFQERLVIEIITLFVYVSVLLYGVLYGIWPFSEGFKLKNFQVDKSNVLVSSHFPLNQVVALELDCL